jgi:hypothetical protein
VGLSRVVHASGQGAGVLSTTEESWRRRGNRLGRGHTRDGSSGAQLGCLVLLAM